MTETRTVEQALERFKLINGAGDQESTACVMTAISWIAGEAWSDHPACAHKLIADLAIRANDADGTTPEQRADIVRGGAGGGLIDTWWVPTETVLACIAKAPKDASPVDHALAVIEAVAAWKSSDTKERADLGGADLVRANLGGADLVRADLVRANLGGANLGGAYGNSSTRLPDGWKVTDAGLVVKS